MYWCRPLNLLDNMIILGSFTTYLSLGLFVVIYLACYDSPGPFICASTRFFVVLAAPHITFIGNRPVIIVENYAIFCGDADEKKARGCSIAVRKNYNNLVEEFAQRRLDVPLHVLS
ncbi:hypothetical protein RB195_007390 [Necator americanus]|uniref:SSD domain-containing protein n=1 Tax=Necator americanus TaxID=51031 RepID=A0ABR1BZZ7_NECAM